MSHLQWRAAQVLRKVQFAIARLQGISVVLTLWIAAICVIGLTACGGKASPSGSTDNPTFPTPSQVPTIKFIPYSNNTPTSVSALPPATTPPSTARATPSITSATTPPSTARATSSTTSATTPPSTPRTTPSARVQVFDDNYEPVVLAVKVGAIVEWYHTGNRLHTTTALDLSWSSGVLNGGDSYQKTFSKVGTYSYLCVEHPWMQGAVVVIP